MAMSCMTNSVYTACDLWSAFNKMAAYNIRQDKSIYYLQQSSSNISNLWNKFLQLKETDFDRKFKQAKVQYK